VCVRQCTIVASTLRCQANALESVIGVAVACWLSRSTRRAPNPRNRAPKSAEERLTRTFPPAIVVVKDAALRRNVAIPPHRLDVDFSERHTALVDLARQCTCFMSSHDMI